MTRLRDGEADTDATNSCPAGCTKKWWYRGFARDRGKAHNSRFLALHKSKSLSISVAVAVLFMCSFYIAA